MPCPSSEAVRQSPVVAVFTTPCDVVCCCCCLPASRIKLMDAWANPAEILLEVGTRGSPSDFKAMSAAYAASDLFNRVATFKPFNANPASGTLGDSGMSQQPSEGVYRRSKPSGWMRFSLLTARGARSVIRNPSLLLAQLGLTIIVALLCVGIFFQLKFNLVRRGVVGCCVFLSLPFPSLPMPPHLM